MDRFEGLSNFRDIGGLATADGRFVKPGMLYRSDALSRITRRDLATLQELDIKLICDLRSTRESRAKSSRLVGESGIEIVNIPLHEQDEGTRRRVVGFLFAKTGDEQFRAFSRQLYHHIAFEQTARVREIVTLLAGGRFPALIHCSAGKDRTGFIAAVLQLLLGVPYDTVIAEYLRSNEAFEPRLARFIKVMRVLTLAQVSAERIRLVLMAHRVFLDEVHFAIVDKYGSVERYLRDACAIDEADLERLKSQLIRE